MWNSHTTKPSVLLSLCSTGLLAGLQAVDGILFQSPVFTYYNGQPWKLLEFFFVFLFSMTFYTTGTPHYVLTPFTILSPPVQGSILFVQ